MKISWKMWVSLFRLNLMLMVKSSSIILILDVVLIRVGLLMMFSVDGLVSIFVNRNLMMGISFSWNDVKVVVFVMSSSRVSCFMKVGGLLV